MSMECVKLVVEAIDTVHWECRKKVRFVPLCGAALDQPVKGSKGPFMSIDTNGGMRTFAAGENSDQQSAKADLRGSTTSRAGTY
jgi:hypothetical protein